MATFTLPANPQFPVGSTVYVYARNAFAESGGPFAAAVTSAVAGADGACSFTGLTGNTAYWAAQQQSGVWVKIAFRTDEADNAGRVWIGDAQPSVYDAGDLSIVTNADGSTDFYLM